MSFCTKCGHELTEEVKFCPNCGEPRTKTDEGGESAQQENGARTQTDPVKKENENDLLMGILAYLSLLVLIPILAAPDSKFARFHANQGLILLIMEAAWSVVKGVLTEVFGLLGLPLIGAALSVFDLAFVVWMIVGIVNVCNGEEKELPLIGKYRLLK